jgi:PAS domain S-box-containing protein
MTGYSAEEYDSMSFLSLVFPDDLETVENAYQELVTGYEFEALPDFRIKTKSGDIKWLSVRGARIDWEGKPAGMVFIKDITERKQQELQLQSYQQRLQALASQLTLTEERERRRIAVELHDHVGQALTLARIQIAAAQNSQTEAARSALLGYTSDVLKDAIKQTRSLVFDLSSPVLNELGLKAAISEWLHTYAEIQAGLKTELVVLGSDLTMSADLRAIIFRNVRELLTNVIRHAQATCVRVTLEQTPTQACVTVQDDGIGFRADEIASHVTRASGFGLFSIQEQMNDLGGSLTVQTTPGEGAKITLYVPHQGL